MTVNTVNITSGPFAGNDVTASFGYAFRIEDKTEVTVFETDDIGAQITLVVDTDYTVAGIGVDGGGTITRVAGALPNGFTWFIRSNYVETQETAFGSQGGFFPDIHERSMDKLTFLIQQILDKQSRAPAVSDSYAGELPLSLPDPVAGKMLTWLDDLTGFKNINVPGSEFLIDITQTPIEPQTLTASQTTVTFSIVDVTKSKIFLTGVSGDGRRLLLDTDYTETSTSIIELTNSYPAGTICFADETSFKTSTVSTSDVVKKFITIASWKNDTFAQVDDVVNLAEHTAGSGEEITGDVIDGTTVNGLDIVQHGTLPISIAIRIKKITTLAPFGLVDGQDSSDMFLRAVALQKAGVISKIVGTSGFEVTATKSVLIDYDNANIDFANMKITWDNAVDEKLKGTGFFELKAIPLFNVFSQVTSDIIKYSNVISVADGTKFSKGDWVALRYTVAQDNSITPTVTPTGAGDFDEIIAKVTEVNSNDVTINLFKAYDYFASPPGGGELRLLVIDKVISGARLQDGNFDTNTPGLASKHNSPISLEYCVSSEFDHIECKNLVGTNIYAVSCSDLKITYPRNETPTGVGGGQGYNVQLINSTDCTVYSPLGIRVRHNVDFSGSSNCRVRDAITEKTTNGALGSHGGYEHNLEYINCKDNNCAISYYIATSGDTFGNHSKNIKITNPTFNNTGKAVHAGSGTNAITKNVEMDGFTILTGGTQNNFMIDIGSDNVTLSNSTINGSINIRGANGVDETDFVISNTELNWLPGNGTVGNTVLKWSGLTDATLILQDCDTSGEFQVTETGQNIKIAGGKYTYVTDNMFNQTAIDSFGLDRFSLKTDINVPESTTITDLVKAKNATISCESFVPTSSNLLFQIDGGATPGPVKIDGNIGDMRHHVRRCTKLSFSNNDNKDGADEMLLIEESEDANIVLANNNLKKITADAKCVRVVAGGHNFLQVSVSGNIHNGVFDLLTGSVEKTVGSANIFRPDGGDTNLQTNFRQAPDADHVYAANIGW